MSETERLKLLVAYDGRPFRGWQSQASSDAVQDHLQRAFQKIIGARVVLHGSGRTDAGVHALGQVAHADVPPGQLPPDRWQAALNAILVPEIKMLKVTRAPRRFHAQFDACGKRYTYRIWNQSFLHPLEIGRAWFVPGALDVATLQAGARLLCGTHDFARFAVNRGQPERDTSRTLFQITVQQRGPCIVLGFTGNGFMYKMVRLMTGSLIRCAQGRAPLSWISRLLEDPKTLKTHFAAPAEGLYLNRVFYRPYDLQRVTPGGVSCAAAPGEFGRRGRRPPSL